MSSQFPHDPPPEHVPQNPIPPGTAPSGAGPIYSASVSPAGAAFSRPEQAARPPRKRSSGLLGCLAVLLVAGGGALLLGLVVLVASMADKTDNSVQEKYFTQAASGSDKVAIIRVEGAILDGDGFVKRQIDRVRRDKNVKAIVLRVDSPGGTVSASDYLYHHLRKLAKEREMPIVVSMGGLCASGGYYLSMAVGHTQDAVFAEPTTWTGSIGVIIPHYNVAGLMAKWEIEEDSIKSHPLKSLGSPTKKLSDEERAVLQSLVDDSFNRFKEIVQSGRTRFAEHPEQLDAVATGQVFTAGQAVANGLVDKVGFVEDAIARAMELASLDPDQTSVVRYNRQPGVMDVLLFGAEVRAQAAGGLDLGRIVDLATPRAYYMWSWLPQAEGISSP